MPVDLSEVTKFDLPYRNLVLTGFLGSGKSTVGRKIAQRLDVEMFDLDDEIELRELMSVAKIRELYGESRLRALEHEYCRQASLMRRAVVVLPGAALLDARNLAVMEAAGQIVVLDCEIGEALRRMHMSAAPRFRDPEIRARLLAAMKRQYQVVLDERLLQIDTTHLSVAEECDLLIELWLTGRSDSPLFHRGPRPRYEPPQRQPLGLAAQAALMPRKRPLPGQEPA